MIYKILRLLDKIKPIESVSAHCDIPCKIYDPITSQLAVLTMIRLVDLIEEIEKKDSLSITDHAQISRLIAQKEEHGHKVKDEIRIIWGDYIKEPQLEKYPELHNLVHSIMLQSSKVKQNIDKNAALELLEKVNRFAEIFWDSKGIDTFKAKSPYPPEKELIYPDLKK
ncbi:MAG: superoxide dismutase, Ni [Rickettsiales bacterium]|nr:superoxide dismutase, Ni [Rickettsiales bacterium]